MHPHHRNPATGALLFHIILMAPLFFLISYSATRSRFRRRAPPLPPQRRRSQSATQVPLPVEIFLAISEHAFPQVAQSSYHHPDIVFKFFSEHLKLFRPFVSTSRALRSLILGEYLRPLAIRPPFDATDVDDCADHIEAIETGKGLWVWMDLEFALFLADTAINNEIETVLTPLWARWDDVKILDITIDNETHFREYWAPLEPATIPKELMTLRFWSSRAHPPRAMLQSATLSSLRLHTVIPDEVSLPSLKELSIYELEVPLLLLHHFLLALAESQDSNPTLSSLYLSGVVGQTTGADVPLSSLSVVALPALHTITLLFTQESVLLDDFVLLVPQARRCIREWSPHSALSSHILIPMVQHLDDVWIKWAPHPRNETAARIVGKHLAFHTWPRVDLQSPMRNARLIPHSFAPKKLYIDQLLDIPHADANFAQAMQNAFGPIQEVHILNVDQQDLSLAAMASLHQAGVKVVVHAREAFQHFPSWISYDNKRISFD